MGAELFLGRDIAGEHPWQLAAEALKTHGVVVGMTGSGKTGLSLVMLEELARAGVPVVAIDPKGDLGNLALLFPRLQAQDFAPWVEREDPSEVATRWRDGLAKWGLGADAMKDLAERLDVRLYTPGSNAGTPVDILGAFRRPTGSAADDPEVRRALVAGAVSGILGLAGHESDPVRDPAHIVLSQIVEAAWARGEDPGLDTLILQLVDPPFQKVGVFPLDKFFPSDDRMKLAMALNAVIASPAFASWTGGDDLDPDEYLVTPDRNGGKTRVNVFTLAHLPDGQRQFFLSLLLARLLAWSRQQPGTSALRAVLFFDEVAGYLPPYPANPPSKDPILTLMKQARAVGFGVVLSTQNPVDLDYKAISNAGLWAIGRLQTAQDRRRLLEGMGRTDLDGAVEGLGKRQFLIADARIADPAVIESRHSMCFLRGPLTREEIGRMKATSSQASAPTRAAPAGRPPPPPAPVDDGLLPQAPPPPAPQRFLDPRVAFSARLGDTFSRFAAPKRADGKTVWAPALHAELELRFDEEKAGFVEDVHEHRVWFPLEDALPDEPLRLDLGDGDLLDTPDEGGRFQPLPTWMDEKRELDALAKRVVEDVYRSESRGLFSNPGLKLYGKAGESRADFDARCEAAVQARVDAASEKIQDRVAREIKRLEDQVRTAEQRISQAEADAKGRAAEEVMNIGETMLSWFTGRSRSVSTAMSKRRQTVAANERVGRYAEDLAAAQNKMHELENSTRDELDALRAKEERALADTQEVEITLEKSDIRLVRFEILWVPVTRRV